MQRTINKKSIEMIMLIEIECFSLNLLGLFLAEFYLSKSSKYKGMAEHVFHGLQTSFMRHMIIRNKLIYKFQQFVKKI